ncbi:MAG: phosphoribosyltransferase family protein [Sulfurovaceae bacterium]|nr:phosphoribosyltransferase family protein [Sulfurovaceae bacterium]
MTKYYYPYSEFIVDLKALTAKIDIKPDTILAIARGGLTIGHFLGEYYNIREVYAINTIGYEDTRKLDEVEVFNIPDLRHAKNVLIVDDIVDSGDTLAIILKTLHEKFPQVAFHTASLFYKSTSPFKPNWYAKEATAWIEFFWTKDLS